MAVHVVSQNSLFVKKHQGRTFFLCLAPVQEKISLLEDHVVVGVVEGVATRHPHQAWVHDCLMGRPAQRLSRRFDAGQLPEGLSRWNGQRTVWTWTTTERLACQARTFESIKGSNEINSSIANVNFIDMFNWRNYLMKGEKLRSRKVKWHSKFGFV